MNQDPIKEVYLKSIFVIDKNGEFHNIRDSVLIKDYIRFKTLPSIDELLDWRNRLNELKLEQEYPEKWFQTEVIATDFLLSKHSQS